MYKTGLVHMHLSVGGWVGYGVEKAETKADVRRGRGVRIAGPYVHMST